MAHWGRPALLLCHTLDLAQELRGAVRRFLGAEAGLIGNGSWEPGEAVTVALVQSLARHPERTNALARRVALVLLDEAHHAPAMTFTDVLQRFPAAFRYGLTATPHRSDGLGSFVEAVVGPVRARVSQEELAAAGALVRPAVVTVPTRFTSDAEDWHAIMAALVADRARNDLLRRYATVEMAAGRRTLILTSRVAHAEELAARLGQSFPGRVAALTGRAPAGERGRTLETFRAGRILGLCATQLADEGLDVPELAVLLLASPTRSPARVAQRVGRLLRPAPGKRAPTVYGFVDAGVGILRAQARVRQAVYESMSARLVREAGA